MSTTSAGLLLPEPTVRHRAVWRQLNRLEHAARMTDPTQAATAGPYAERMPAAAGGPTA